MALHENKDHTRPSRKRKEINYEEPELSFEEGQSGKDSFQLEYDKDKLYSNKSVYILKNKKKEVLPVNFEEDQDDVDMSEYEKQRLKNVEENRKKMLELGILDAIKEVKEIVHIKTKRIKKEISTPFVTRKRSLRLEGKAPTGETFTPTINDTPKETSLSFRSRKVEVKLSMGDDEACLDMLDKLRNCFSSSSSEVANSSTSSVEVERLIDDMRGLHVAAVQTKVVNRRIQSICVHPMESKLLVIAGSIDGLLGLWDVGSDSSLAEYEPHVRPVNCISVSSTDHSKLFSTSHDGTVRRADIQKGTFDLVYQTDEDSKASHITWHCELDEHTLLVAHGNGVVGVVDIRLDNEKSLTLAYNCHARSVRTVQLHPVQSKYFLTSSGTGESKIFDIRQKHKNADYVCNLVHKRSKFGYGLTSAFFSPDGNKVLTTCNDDRLRVFDVTDLQKPIEAHRVIHDNHTGRWLSVFKAKWHPVLSDIFFIGSMQYPKRIQIYNGNGEIMREIKSDDLTTICPVLDIHSTQSIVAGGDSVGRVYIFTTQTHVDRLNL